uniref:Diguanylate cyclase n=1 Tax=Ditylenchus dipsaci TaxID=166011 RepID=A0A915DRG6_9BILA
MGYPTRHVCFRSRRLAHGRALCGALDPLAGAGRGDAAEHDRRPPGIDRGAADQRGGVGAVQCLADLSVRVRLLHFIGHGARLRCEDRERLRMAAAVFDSTLEGVLVTDRQGLIVHVNRAFMRITGYQQHEAFYQQVYATLAEKGEWSGEIWNRRKSGEIYPQWQTICAIHDDEGELSHYVAVFSDISAIKHSEQELAYLAHHDPLTGLPNRLLFNDRVEQALAAAQANKLAEAGGERLGKILGNGVTLARLGGDEFGVLAEGCQQVGQAGKLAQGIIERMREPFLFDGHRLFISVSAGISLFPSDALCAEQLLRNADSALYKAKGNGRACYALYTEELTAHAQHRVETAGELRRALEHDELRVFFQPVHDLATGSLVGVEALVRWQHPQRGLVPPASSSRSPSVPA